MKKAVKILSGIILLLAVCSGILSGCRKAGNPAVREETGEEPMEITVAFWDAKETLVGDEVQSAIEEKLNIRIVPVNVTWDDYDEKITLWAETGSLPDLVAGDFRQDIRYVQWAENGLLKQIPDDLSAYPNLEKYLNESDLALDARIDEKLYCIPRQTYPSQEWTSVDRIVAYRWDLAVKAGITKEPESWEEFEEMILAIIKADPENANIRGLTATGASLLSGILLPYASSLAAAENLTFNWEKCGDGVYRPAYFAENLLPAFELGRTMYTTGVIDPDIMMVSTQTASEQFLRGKNAAILYSGGVEGEYRTISMYWEEMHGKSFFDDVKILHLMPDVNGAKSYPVWGRAWSESLISGKVDEKKLDRILKLYDYLLSEEGTLFSSYGPEGELYEKKDDKIELRDRENPISETYPSTMLFSNLVRWNPSKYDERFASDIPDIYMELNRELVSEAAGVKVPEVEKRCSQIQKRNRNGFEIHAHKDFLEIMTGTDPVEEMWEKILAQYEEEGLAEVIRIVNEQME